MRASVFRGTVKATTRLPAAAACCGGCAAGAPSFCRGGGKASDCQRLRRRVESAFDKQRLLPWVGAGQRTGRCAWSPRLAPALGWRLRRRCRCRRRPTGPSRSLPMPSRNATVARNAVALRGMHAAAVPSPCVLRCGVICAARNKYGREANSALNRGAGAGEDTYLRMAQLLGYEETAARQALRSAPVLEDRDGANGAVEAAVGAVQRYVAPSYSEFEAALKGSGFGIKKLKPHNIALPKAADRGGLRRRPDGMWKGTASSGEASAELPDAASSSSVAASAPAAVPVQPATPSVTPPQAPAVERPERPVPPPTREDFARLLAASGVRVTAADKGDDGMKPRKGAAKAVPAGTVRLQWARSRGPEKSSAAPAAPGPADTRRPASEPKLKPAERRAQQQRRDAALMTPLLPDGRQQR